MQFLIFLEGLVVKLKNTLKVVIASLLVVACSLAIFGCVDNDINKPVDGKLPNQLDNRRYYFQQGYRTDWDIITQDADRYMVNRETGLIMTLAPLQMTKDEEGNDVPVQKAVEENGETVMKNVPVENVEYCIYYYNGTGIYMTTSRADLVRWLKDPDSDFYFNNKHNINGPRDTFLEKGESTIYTAKFSKLQFSTQAYTFTRDGEDWQGVYNIVMSGMEYFIVTYEAKADLYDKYLEAYTDTIGDFRKKGWETSDVG